MTPKRRRLWFVASAFVGVGAATALALTALEDSIVFFYSPTEISEKPPGDETVRVGGLVEAGSVVKADDTVTFRITDLKNTLAVAYRGALPDLFREGQGVVVEGRVTADGLQAASVLAKHDENYMPPEVARALRDSGQWQHYQDKEGAEP